eukprot:5524378-Prymnesium_polylepis.1
MQRAARERTSARATRSAVPRLPRSSSSGLACSEPHTSACVLGQEASRHRKAPIHCQRAAWTLE